MHWPYPLLVAVSTAPVWAAPIVSPEVRPDRTITFRFRAPNAQGLLAFGAMLQDTNPSVPGRAAPTPISSAEIHAAYYGQKNYGGGSAGLVLFKDGTAMRRLPSQGLDGFDHRREAAADTMGWFGRWTDSGSTIRISWQTGSTSVYNKRGSAIVGDNAILVRVECPPDFRFEGDYERNLAPLPSAAIRFNADGTFIDSGAVSSLGLSEQPPPQGRGTYIVRKFSIEFRFERGPVIRAGFFVTPGPGSAPSGIFINTYGLTRK